MCRGPLVRDRLNAASVWSGFGRDRSALITGRSRVIKPAGRGTNPLPGKDAPGMVSEDLTLLINGAHVGWKQSH